MVAPVPGAMETDPNFEEDVPAWVAAWGVWAWGVLLVGTALCFWAQAVVCEERFVPALNVICSRLRIPDDVAGATLMAAGASSPEVFASLVALFVTHSSLGIGTVVGSEIFNHLCICAGSVLSSRTGSLTLEPRVVARECGSYAVALALLWVALTGDQERAADDPRGPEHIFVAEWAGLMLLGGYGCYVALCVGFDALVARACPRSAAAAAAESAPAAPPPAGGYGSINGGDGGGDAARVAAAPRTQLLVDAQHPTFRFCRQISLEPPENFEPDEHGVDRRYSSALGRKVMWVLHRSQSSDSGGGGGGRSPTVDGAGDGPRGGAGGRGGAYAPAPVCEEDAAALAAEAAPDDGGGGGFVARQFSRLVSLIALVDETDEDARAELEAIDDGGDSGAWGCYLWQRSRFYTKARLGVHAWQLRWFELDAAGCRSRRARDARPGGRELHYGLAPDAATGASPWCAVSDAPRRTFALSCAQGVYELMAPTDAALAGAVARLDALCARARQAPPATPRAMLALEAEAAAAEHDEPPLVEWPRAGAGAVAVATHVALLPLKAAIHYTVADVRARRAPGLGVAGGACFACVAWMGALSFVMCSCCEALGALLGMPPSVVGVTFSAVGTSLPNLIASMVAANQGLGNMAVSNAFGSNTFNICVGLGLPWALFVATANHGAPYHTLPAEGIVDSVLILIGALVFFFALLVSTGFVLYRWHGFLFIALYVAYLVYAIGKVYLA